MFFAVSKVKLMYFSSTTVIVGQEVVLFLEFLSVGSNKASLTF